MNDHPQDMALQAIWPWHYTDHEGGSWSYWGAGPVTASTLATAQAQTHLEPDGTPTVVLGGLVVHGLLFGPWPNQDRRTVARWDCLNGWTG